MMTCNQSMSSVLFRGPITAVEFLGKLLLSGEGPYLSVYDTETAQQVAAVEVLFPCNIHGIRKEDWQQNGNALLCVYGQKSARIIEIDKDTCTMRSRLTLCTDVCEFEDWIWDVVWLKPAEMELDEPVQLPTTLALALGHNIVLCWNWRKNVIIHRVVCEEKCILYSARFIGHCWSSLVVAAGTVFNQVVLWSVCGEMDHIGHQRVLHRLTGHQGVIFSIEFSKNKHLLCSASDDRSVRIWQINSSGTLHSQDGAPSQWTNVEFNLLHVLYGHSARVWDVKLTEKFIITIGEDATCIVWNYSGDVVHNFKGHKGKSIWSLAVREDQLQIATGGGDCSVRVWDISSLDVKECDVSTRALQIPQVAAEGKDFPRSVVFIRDMIAVMTNEGHLYLINTTSNPHKSHLPMSSISTSDNLHLMSSPASTPNQPHLDSSPTAPPAEPHLESSPASTPDEPHLESIPTSTLNEPHLLMSSPASTLDEPHLKSNQTSALDEPHLESSPASTPDEPHLESIPTSTLNEPHLLMSSPASTLDEPHLKSNQTSALDEPHLKSSPTSTPDESHMKPHPASTFNEPHLLMSSPDYRSYSVLSVTRCGRLLAVGNIHGRVKLFYFDNSGKLIWEHEVAMYSGKVMSLVWLKPQGGMSVGTLASTGPGGQLILSDVAIKDMHISFSQLAALTLPSCKQRWISAGAVLQESQLFVCGDRGGTVHTYKLTGSDGQPCQSFPKLHGKAGVTDVSYHDNYVFTSGRDGQYRQYRVEDGRLCLMTSKKVYKGFEWIDRLLFTNEDLLILGFHTSKFILWSVNHNEKLFEVECGGGHRTWDFHLHGNMAKFVYLKTREVLLCEGSVRMEQPLVKCSLHGREMTDIAYIGKVTDKNGDLAHICATASEDTSVNIVKISNKPKVPMNLEVLSTLQGHLSSVRALAIADDTTGKVKVMFSGGGRAQIKCWLLNKNRNENTPDADNTVKQKSDDQSYSVELLCSYMMENKGRKSSKPWKQAHYNPNPETRFMALTAFHSNEIIPDVGSGCLYFVGAACSDGSVRLFTLDVGIKEFKLLAASGFHDHCVLTVDHIIVHNQTQNNKSIVLYTGGTDGRIALWDITGIVTQCIYTSFIVESEDSVRQGKSIQNTDRTINDDGINELPKTDIEMPNLLESESVCASKGCEDELNTKMQSLGKNQKLSTPSKTLVHYDSVNEERNTVTDLSDPCLVVTAHQSGVNSMCCKQYDDAFLLASGGDDNSLNVVNFTLEPVSSETSRLHGKVQYTQTVKAAHAAQITGLHILSPHHILTASIDQRLSLWSVTPEKVSHVTSKFLSVADVSSMQVWKTEDFMVAVVGVGIQILKIKLD